MNAVKSMRWIAVAALIVFLACPPAWAGFRHHRHHRHIAGGVALGVGAAILGTALLAPYAYAAPPATTVVVHAPPPPPAGHWETRDVWVPGSSERVWNPAHYNRRGEWVPGHWMSIERSPGYYRQERVWVQERW